MLCADVFAVMLFLAVQVYWPLLLVEEVCRLSIPLFGALDVMGCPLLCHEKRAGGSEAAVQVRLTVCPTNTSPPPTQLFGVVLVSTGVSGPSGLLIIRGQRYQSRKDLLYKYNERNFLFQRAEAQIICSAKGVIIVTLLF